MINRGMVSIIMPSYNTDKYIAESIESVLSQTYQNWELIIVDDCSTDNTDTVVQKFINDSRILYFKNKHNNGAAFSRNYGLKVAKGKWIAFLDSDDLWTPDKLEKQIEFMINGNYHFSYTNYIEIDDKSNPLNVFITGPQKISKQSMYNYCWPGCLTVMYDFEKIGLIQIEDIKKNNDYAMWLRVCEKVDCHLLDEILAKYRKRPGSISRNGITVMISWHYKLWNEVEKKGRVASIYYTFCNLIFGFWKKIKYVKRNNNVLNVKTNRR